METNSIQLWEPIANLPKKVFVRKLIQDFDGLTIELINYNDNSEVVVITFDCYYGYRNLDESYHFRTWGEIPILSQNWSFFKSLKGDFITTFNYLNFDIFKGNVVSYIITSLDDIIEVLTTNDAKVIVRIEGV